MRGNGDSILYGKWSRKNSPRPPVRLDFNPLWGGYQLRDSLYFEGHGMLWSGCNHWVARSSTLPDLWKDEARRVAAVNHFYNRDINVFLNTTTGAYRPDSDTARWLRVRFDATSGTPEEDKLFSVVIDEGGPGNDTRVLVSGHHLDAVEELTNETGIWMISSENILYYLDGDSHQLLGMVRSFGA